MITTLTTSHLKIRLKRTRTKKANAKHVDANINSCIEVMEVKIEEPYPVP